MSFLPVETGAVSEANGLNGFTYRPCHDDAQSYELRRAALIVITGARQRDTIWQAIARQAA